MSTGVFLLEIALGSVFLVGGWSFFAGSHIYNVLCEEVVQLGPDIMDGALCGLLSAALLVGPFRWVLPGFRRHASIVEDEAGLAWRRPRTTAVVPVITVFGCLITLGAMLATTRPRAAGLQCEVEVFDGPADRPDPLFSWSEDVSAGTCAQPGLSEGLREVCATSTRAFHIELTLLLLFVLTFPILAWAARRPVGRIVIDARGVGLDDERIPWADLDDVEVVDEVLRFIRFDGSVRAVPIWSGEQEVALATPLLPRDPEDRPEARQKLAQLT
ncbi:MAG: hypothetical protein KDA28_06915 [Phycisphaerales bacterium]|nr:hypothetical protein [Phycisphaerales bacterium]